MCGWMAGELADHTQGPEQPSAEGTGKSGSSPAPGLSQGMQISPAPQGSAAGSVFQLQPWPCRVIPSN